MTKEQRRKQLNDSLFKLGENMARAYAGRRRKQVQSKEVKK